MGDFVGFLMISGCTTRRFRGLVIVWVGVTVKLFVVMDAPCMRPRRRLYDFWTFADVVWHVWIDWWFIPCTFLELVRMFDWYLLFGCCLFLFICRLFFRHPNFIADFCDTPAARQHTQVEYQRSIWSAPSNFTVLIADCERQSMLRKRFFRRWPAFFSVVSRISR